MHLVRCMDWALIVSAWFTATGVKGSLGTVDLYLVLTA